MQSAVEKIAVAVVLKRAWPAKGSRHDAALALGGLLSRADWDAEDIGEFVGAVATEAGDEQAPDRRRAAVDAAREQARGGKAYGFPKVSEIFGEETAKNVARVLGYGQSKSGFEVGAKGLPQAKSQHNIRTAMALLGVEVRYDMFHDRMLITGLPGHSVLDDNAMEKLWLAVDAKYNFLPQFDFFIRVVRETARRNSFHPVRDYLDGLKWDEAPRIDGWLTNYAQADSTPYLRAVGKNMLVAAVRRVRHPGCKFDEMPVFESPQGKNKSSALRVLAVEEDWYSDDLPLNADSKKLIEQTIGRWIVEVPELSGMRKVDIEHLKSQLSRQVDHARMSYGRMPTEKKREFITVGTTNDDKYLRDPTGNRRYWPIKTPAFDLEALKRDRDQLWAEAAAREAKGESIRLDPSLWDAAAIEQGKRTVEDPWIDAIRALLGDMKGKITSADAWALIGLPAGQRTQQHNQRFGSAMTTLGWERTKVRIDGAQTWGYVRGRERERKRICVERDYYTKEISVYLEGGNMPNGPPKP